MCCATQSTKRHHRWEGQYLLEFAMGRPAGMGELLGALGFGELLSLPWHPIVLL